MSHPSSNLSFLKKDASDLLSLYKKYESFPNNLRYSKQSNISPSRNNVRESIISLMKELNLNAKLQQELLYYADTGKSFPFLPRKIINCKDRKAEKRLSAKLLKLPDKPMQRTKSTIEQIGAYEREQFRPNPSKTRAPSEKERLQNLMAFGEDLNKEPNIITIKSEPSRISKEDLFNEILIEIKERKDFLDEMAELGEGKKYLADIQCQIALRLRELEKLDKDRAQPFVSMFGI